MAAEQHSALALLDEQDVVGPTGTAEALLPSRVADSDYEIEVDDILTLISDLRKQAYSGTTIVATLTSLSRIFGHAVRRGLIESNPVSKLDRSERPRVSR